MALILRAGDRAAVPWKNGGGVTREVAVHPPASDLGTFDWRVSVAQVHAGGPFSSFPGVDRRMAVLEGRLLLSIAGRAAIRLSPDTAPVCFPGEVAASAELAGGPATDLNVMTRRGRFDSRLTRYRVQQPLRLALRPGTALVFALSPLGLRCGDSSAALSKLDAALIDGPAECEVRAPDPQGALYLIELEAMTRTR